MSETVEKAATAPIKGVKKVGGKLTGRPAWVYLAMAAGIVVIAYVVNQRRAAAEEATAGEEYAYTPESAVVDPGYITPSGSAGSYFGGSQPWSGDSAPAATGPQSNPFETFFELWLGQQFAPAPTGGSPGSVPAGVHTPPPEVAPPPPPPPPPPEVAPPAPPRPTGPPPCPNGYPHRSDRGCYKVDYENRERNNGKSGRDRRVWCNRITIHRYSNGQSFVVAEDKIRDGGC